MGGGGQPVTNKIYVANNGDANVTAIDGATNTTTPVNTGTGPQAVAVNTGSGSSPMPGAISAYVFLVRVPWTTYADATGTCGGNSPCFTRVQAAISSTLAGGSVVVSPGDYPENVTLDQNVAITCTGNITLAGMSQLSGTLTAPIGTLTLNGDLARSGGTFNANGGTVAFIGNDVTRTLTSTVPTQLNHLAIGSGVTLTLSTNNDNVGVGGVLTNQGTLRKPFGLTGVTLHLGVLGNLSGLTVDRIDQNHISVTVGLQTDKWWNITPNTDANGTFSATLSLTHGGPTDPRVCKWSGSAGWDCAHDGYDLTTVWRSGLASFSAWAVGNQVGPTAVRVRSFAAVPGPAHTAWQMLLALMLGLGALFIAQRSRRKA